MPNFFIVGAAKCGTTSIYNYISQHPQIWMPTLKEPHFFGEHRPPGPSFASLDDYLSLFEQGRNYPALGEASTAYIYSNSAAREIFQFNPEARIIMVLRNPRERAYSLYWHNVRAGIEKLSFEDALAAESQRINDGYRYSFHYVTSGLYAQQVKRYQAIFPPEQVRVFLFEELQQSADRMLTDVFRFLEVDTDFLIDTKKAYNLSGPPRIRFVNNFLHNQSRLKRVLLSFLPIALKQRWKSTLLELNSAQPPVMSPATASLLTQTFAEDIAELSGLCNKDLTEWLKAPTP